MSQLEYWQSVIRDCDAEIATAEITLCEARDDRANALRMIRELEAEAV